MPFGHKLAHRLAMRRIDWCRALLLALPLTVVASCEKPIVNGPNPTVAQLVVSPTAVTLQPNQVEDFMAVGFTAAGDTADIAVTWSATAGTVDTNSNGGRHYGHYKNGSCGSFKVVATSHPGSISDSASVTVTCPVVSAAQSTVGAAPTTLTAGSGSATVTVTVKDANGTPMSGATVVLAATGSGNTLTQPSGTTNASGVATGTLSSTVAGAKTVSATANGTGITQTATVTVVAGPVSAGQSTVAAAPTSIVVGSGTSTITVTAKDANGNRISGATVVLAATGSGNTLTQPSGPTDASGVATGSLSSSVAEAKTVSATISGTGVTQTAVVTVSATPVSASQSTVAAAPTTLTAGSGSATVTVTVKDANGTPMSGATVVLAATGSGNTLTQPSGTTNASGVATGTLSSTVAGAKTVSATANGTGITQTATVTVVAGPVSAGQSTVAAAPTSIVVGSGTSTITVTAKDANGNRISGATVVLAATGSGNTLTQPSGPTNASGVATGSLSSSVAEAKTVSATIGGTGVTQTATVTVTPVSTGSQFGHVFVVTEENTDYASVIGSSSMPYLNALAQQYGLATQYYANTHPSIGNYFELSTGQIITNNDSYSTIVTVDNIVRRLLAAGKTWKSYAESIPNACYLGGDTGNYARKHNIFPLLSDVANDPTGQGCNNVPFTQFATDLANGTLPAFSNIVPNLCNDAHDCGLDVADGWLQTNIAPLIASPVFQQDGLLIIVFDESGGDNTHGGGRVAWVAVSPKSKRGYQSTTLYQHQSTLRLILQGLGVTVFPGDAATAPDMSEFFTP